MCEAQENICTTIILNIKKDCYAGVHSGVLQDVSNYAI